MNERSLEERLNSTPTGQHMLLAEFVLPFAPGESEPTETDGVTDGRAQLWIDDGELRLSIYSRTLGRFEALNAQAIGDVAEEVAERFEEQEGTTDLKDVLVNAEMLADGEASPLDLDGGELLAGSIGVTDDVEIGGGLVVEGATFLNDALQIQGNVGFYNFSPIAQPNVTGSKGGNAALTSLMSALVSLGLVTDGTS